MKAVMNKEVSLRLESGENGNYGELIKMCARQVPPQGFDVQQMRERQRVLDAVEAAEKNSKGKKKADIQLEDADFAVALGCIKSMRWGALSKEIIEFVDYMDNL